CYFEPFSVLFCCIRLYLVVFCCFPQLHACFLLFGAVFCSFLVKSTLCTWSAASQDVMIPLVTNLVTVVSTTAMDASKIAMLLCFKKTYKMFNDRMDSMRFESELDDADLARRISTLGHHYRTLRRAVDGFNAFFGLSVLLQLSSTILATLGFLTQVTLTDLPINVYNNVVTPKVISIVTIILCSDSVLEEAEKSVFISLELSERLPWQSQKRTEIFSLTQTCKDYAPEFSVLGLFCIKRSTILDLFNITSTLMIVLVQSRNV
ncbi:unnamed protein product, partial [Callosobruchus maculatus]